MQCLKACNILIMPCLKAYNLLVIMPYLYAYNVWICKCLNAYNILIMLCLHAYKILWIYATSYTYKSDTFFSSAFWRNRHSSGAYSRHAGEPGIRTNTCCGGGRCVPVRFMVASTGLYGVSCDCSWASVCATLRRWTVIILCV